MLILPSWLSGNHRRSFALLQFRLVALRRKMLRREHDWLGQ